MPRFRKRVPSRLTLDQEDFLLTGGLLSRYRGEDVDQAVRRLFGGWQEAKAAYVQHRESVLGLDPTAGSRPWAWWQFEAPPWPSESAKRLALRTVPTSPERPFPFYGEEPGQQVSILRGMGLLTEAEEADLSRWRDLRLVPGDLK